MPPSNVSPFYGMLNDHQIKQYAEMGMIEPFSPSMLRQVENPRGLLVKSISRGLSTYGYDLTLDSLVRVCRAGNGEIDPKNPNPSAFVPLAPIPDTVGSYVLIPPNTFALGSSKEYFRMPRDITGIAVGKSTYLRVGVWCPISPLEAGWEGNLTIEIANVGPMPVRVYLNEGITQVVFFKGEVPDVTYADRPNNYQAQNGLTLSKV